ncbi:beta-1,3-galactosyltransferase 1-like [Tubulanus polymorphus]|uniref:beta-1,3-galactosyltransferase 1-like n=1 Tax=Tubulanus polymorphus TaxID=672921 RepID=UPI003DA3AA5B
MPYADDMLCIRIVRDVQVNRICPSSLHFLSYIHTAVRNWERRQYVRNTWARIADQHEYRFRIVFFIGKVDLNESEESRLRQEMAEYEDIVQLSFVEHYRNLTMKGLAAMSWIEKNCAHIKYVVKTDDDVFVNVPRLSRTLRLHFRRHPGNPPPILCRVMHGSPVFRARGKWIVTRGEYAGDFYPDYCSGLGFLLDMRTLVKLIGVALRTKYFWVDDVHFTGIIREAAKIKIGDLTPVFQYYGSPKYQVARSRLTELRKEFIHLDWQTEFTNDKDVMTFSIGKRW